MTRQTYDVAVIGGGVAGLATAALLGRRGMRVLVLEARAELGGLTSTSELVPGLSGDTVEHELGWIPLPLLEELGLRRPGDDFQRVSPCVSGVAPDGEGITLYPDVTRTVESLKRHSAKDAAAWPAFAERVARLGGFLQSLYSVPAPSLFATGAANTVTMLSLGRRARALGREGIFDLLRTLPMSIADVLDETFENEGLKGLLASRGVTRLMQGPKSGATAFVFLHHHVGLPAGAVRAICSAPGGVGTFTAALATVAKSHAVAIRTDAPVARIVVRRDRVTGVVLGSGEEIAAPRVVSSVDVKRTLHELLEPEDVTPELSRAVGNVRMRGATAVVNLVLEGGIPLRLPNADAARGTLVVAPSMRYLEKGFDRAKHGAVAEEPYLEITVTRAAAGGRAGVSVLAQWAPYHLKDAQWNDTTRQDLGDRVLRTLERSFPGVSGRTVWRQVLSPLDIEREYGAAEGSLTHGELALDQILFMRPVPPLNRYRSESIEGLFLCGRGCHPGMPAPAAYLAAREVLRSARGREPARRPAPPAA